MAELKTIPEIPFGLVRPNIHDEYSRLRKVLVVPSPAQITSFTDLVVNPIQSQAIAGCADSDIVIHPGAAEKHGSLLSTLKGQGVELVYSNVIPTKPGHTPLFTRDIGIVIDDRVLPSRLRFPYRAVEVQGLLDILDPNIIIRTDRDYMIEGGDVAIIDPNLILGGIGPRTNLEALALLRETFPKKEFIPVYPVKEDKAFHIDTVSGILGEKHLLYLPELFPSQLAENLKERGFNFVNASPDEWVTCCTNVLAIGDNHVISPAENTVTNERMQNDGVTVIPIPLSGILSQGGGPHCLTLPLVRN